MLTVEQIEKGFPLHWLVWNNRYRDLDARLREEKDDKEKLDSRGRTPLMLAVTLGHIESSRVLLRHNANVNVENRAGWNVVHEAVSTGDPELLQLMLEQRDFQRHSLRVGGIPALLQRLKEAPDFYVEMKWEFTSWFPLVSRMCPSDTYKVYKRGSTVRIDTTLLGFDQSNSWQRGSRSYIFKGQSDTATLIEVDHDARQVCTEQMRVPRVDEDPSLASPTEEAVAQRLTAPTVITYVDTEKISFERSKSGVWGWRSDKTEVVNGHESKVFSATNVELVYKTRTEHLPDKDKERVKQAARTPLQMFFGAAEEHHQDATPEDLQGAEQPGGAEATEGAVEKAEEVVMKGNPCSISPEEYFGEDDLGQRDIGRPKEISTKIQKFKATLWLCESYPLSLPEQIMPIVDLMAISSSHFAKLKDFIQLQLPSGFPVRIEIPVFHVLNARITFGNIFGMDDPVIGVNQREDGERVVCNVDDSCFDIPQGYAILGSEYRRQFTPEEEDELLQFAIQQSLLEAGSEREEVDIWEALRGQQRAPVPMANNLRQEEERQLQRAIQESLCLSATPSMDFPPPHDTNLECRPQLEASADPDLEMALVLSKREREEEERRQKEEEEMLRKVLELSLTEK